jgi:hypothetical protein
VGGGVVVADSGRRRYIQLEVLDILLAEEREEAKKRRRREK